MQSLGGLDAAQRFLSVIVGQEAADAFQPWDCDFPYHKDRLEGLTGHFNQRSLCQSADKTESDLFVGKSA